MDESVAVYYSPEAIHSYSIHSLLMTCDKIRVVTRSCGSCVLPLSAAVHVAFCPSDQRAEQCQGCVERSVQVTLVECWTESTADLQSRGVQHVLDMSDGLRGS